MSLAALKAQLEAQKKKLEEYKQRAALANKSGDSEAKAALSQTTDTESGLNAGTNSSETVTEPAPSLAQPTKLTQGGNAIASKSPTANVFAVSKHVSNDESSTPGGARQSGAVSTTEPKQVSLEDACNPDELADITIHERDLVFDVNSTPSNAPSSSSESFTFTAAQRRTSIENLVDFVVGTDSRPGKGLEFLSLLQKKYNPSLLASANPSLKEKIFLFNWLFDPLSDSYRCFLGLLRAKSQDLYEKALSSARTALEQTSEHARGRVADSPAVASSPHGLSDNQEFNMLSEKPSSSPISSIVREHSALLAALGSSHILKERFRQGAANSNPSSGDSTSPLLSASSPNTQPPRWYQVDLPQKRPSPTSSTNAMPPAPPQPAVSPAHVSFISESAASTFGLGSESKRAFVHPSRQVAGVSGNTASNHAEEDAAELKDFVTSSAYQDARAYHDESRHVGLGAGPTASSIYYASFTQTAQPDIRKEDGTVNTEAAIQAMEQVYKSLAEHRGGVRSEEEMLATKPFTESVESEAYQDWLFETGRTSGDGEGDRVVRPPPPKRMPGAPLDESNPGFRMLMKMGWKQGTPIGSRAEGLVAPIEASQRKTHMGLGLGKEAGQAKRGGENVSEPADPFEAYRQRMQEAYRNRPNPMGNPRRVYY